MGRRRDVVGGHPDAAPPEEGDAPRGSIGTAPCFVGADGVAHDDFQSAISAGGGAVQIDAVAAASMLSLQYVVDGRSTLVGVRRPRWSTTTAMGDRRPAPAALTGYGRRLMTGRAAADELLRRLRAELERAFAGADRVTVLLSGGLDSRLSAAVVVELARAGRITDDIRAVTWGIPESRDRHYGARVARGLAIEHVAIELGPADLLRNVDIAACELGALMSPVHLHAVDAVRRLDWHPGDRILASTLGNGVGRGTYLYRHVSYARPPAPADWLGLLHPGVAADADGRLHEDLASFRRDLAGHPPIAVHECEMLAHYVSGMLLPLFGVLDRTAAPVHQALSDPATYGFVWSLSPLARTASMYRHALRRCALETTDVPYALTNRPLGRRAGPERNDLSPHVHRYPRWITRELADVVDELLSRDWLDATGCFDAAAVRATWEGVRRHDAPHPHTTYLLLWLCALRRLTDRVGVTGPPLQAAARRGVTTRQPPWGFAGRPAGPRWQRLPDLPRQAVDVARCWRT